MTDREPWGAGPGLYRRFNRKLEGDEYKRFQRERNRAARERRDAELKAKWNEGWRFWVRFGFVASMVAIFIILIVVKIITGE
jgi:hypothetical protein